MKPESRQMNTADRLAALQRKCSDLALENRALKQEIERLKLQSEHADCWWDDDSDFGSPEEYADECDLKVDDEFELRAAAYWTEKFRVTSVRNRETDEGDFDCEQISKRREEFPIWFELKAERDALKEKVAALENDVVIEKPDAICKHCGNQIFWWSLSHFWSHGEGDHMGLVNCYGTHDPSRGIINPGPFAEPKEEHQ